jgi:hypothetical protein
MKEPDSRASVRSKSYGIAHATCKCSACGAQVPVIALALPPFHESLVAGSAADDDAGVWQAAPWNAFLFYVEYLSEPAAQCLKALSSNYRLSSGAEAGDSHWANHCPACGVLLEDHDLFCEPDGAFLPTSADAASMISLVWMDEFLEAAAAGYVCEPEFFDAMTAD